MSYVSLFKTIIFSDFGGFVLVWDDLNGGVVGLRI